MKTLIQSPFADCQAQLKRKKMKAEYRGESFEFERVYYECEETKETFTTSDQSEINSNQVFNQYRERHGIPYPDELKSFRNKYGISAQNMSRILGLGINQYSKYENGEVPSLSSGKMLSLVISSPEVFANFVEDEELKNRILSTSHQEATAKNLIFSGYKRGIYNGFAVQSVEKLKNVISFFVGAMGETYQTKMNKLLFYADFDCYRETGQSITGLSYKALPYGIVPSHFEKIYALTDGIECIPDDMGGVKITSDSKANMELFSEKEKESLNKVCAKFKDYSCREISKTNHEESVWKKYNGSNQYINFTEAFSLSTI